LNTVNDERLCSSDIQCIVANSIDDTKTWGDYE
jgi:hypothetical protein